MVHHTLALETGNCYVWISATASEADPGTH